MDYAARSSAGRGRPCFGKLQLPRLRRIPAYRCLPEPNGFDDPSLGTRAYAEPEAMPQTLVLVVLHLGTGFEQGLNPFFHDGWRSNPILLAHDHERGRLSGRVIRMRCVCHHNGGRLWKVDG